MALDYPDTGGYGQTHQDSRPVSPEPTGSGSLSMLSTPDRTPQQDSRPVSSAPTGSGNLGIQTTPTDESSHEAGEAGNLDSQHIQLEDEGQAPNTNGETDTTNVEQTAKDPECDSSVKSKPEVLKLWILEITAIILAVGLLVAIFLILAAHNGKQSSAWALPISLSALIATLSTISRSSIAMIASEIISQRKWSWLGNTKPSAGGVPLRDIEVFDQASRGPWGSILLLKNSLKSPHLFLTLLVALISNAMGPFAQQAVLSVECQYVDKTANATIPNLQTVGYFGVYSDNASEIQMDPALKTSMLSSFQQPTGNDTAIIPSCTTGNCTFPLYKESDGSQVTHRSVGFCSRCLDVSPLVEHSTTVIDELDSILAVNQSFRADRWVLPNEHSITYSFLNNTPGGGSYVSFLNISTDFVVPRSTLFPSDTADFFTNSTHALVNITFLSLDDFGIGPSDQWIPSESDKLAVSATTCTIFPCLRNYHASVSKGDLSETFVSSEQLIPYGGEIRFLENSEDSTYAYPSEMISTRTPCFVEGQMYTSENISTASNAVTMSRWYFDGQSPPNPGPFEFWHETWEKPDYKVNITAPPECIYAMDTKSWYTNARIMMQSALRGNCWTDSSIYAKFCRELIQPLLGTPRPAEDSVSIDYFWLEGFARLSQRTTSDLSTYMDHLAESLTRKLRMNVDGVPGRAIPGYEWRLKDEMVVGEAWQTTTCFAVDWRWLILSSGLTAIALGVLTWSVIHGAMVGQVVWKSSTLPMVFYRDRMVIVVSDGEEVPRLEAEEEAPLMSIKDMEAETKRIKVIFRSGESKI